jgi:hypothetical protein
MTKTELIAEYKRKTARAKPMVKRVAYRGLKYQTKADLERMVRKARVTSSGGISFV